MLHKHRPGWFQGLCPWRVQGRALVLLPFPGFLGAGNGHEVLAARLHVSIVAGTSVWVRAGKGKTCWAKPLSCPFSRAPDAGCRPAVFFWLFSSDAGMRGGGRR